MTAIELVIILIVAVLVSALLEQLTNKISAPLIQIALGVILAFTIEGASDVSIDPDLFLVLFIAPLLFNEASRMDRLGFWKNRGMILSLALGLVVATLLAVGYALNALEPSIGLAAAFALGAALGPTDAVSVLSLSKTANLSDRQRATLSGESLINDATGLVGFQFAVAAAVTGTFSLIDAGIEFLILFFGGILLGAVAGWLLNLLMSLLRAQGYENRTFHVLFEVATPFAVFLIAEHLGVSGVLAVVACGIVFNVSRSQIGASASKMRIVSSGVWDVLSFALNGIVFVLLGLMLPNGVLTELTEDGTGATINWELLGIAFIVTAIVIACRFVWVMIVDRVFGQADEIDKGLLRHAAILSFAGPKGAITLSIALTLPLSLACRSDLIFIASVVIVMTLLLANFVVPILSPAIEKQECDKEEETTRAQIKILRGVIEKLTDEADGKEGFIAMSYRTVIEEYNARTRDLKAKSGIDDGSEIIKLRGEALEWQANYAKDLLAEGRADSKSVEKLTKDINKKQKRLAQRNKLTWKLRGWFVKTFADFKPVTRGATKLATDEEYRTLKRKCLSYVIGRLSESIISDENQNSENASTLMSEYQKALISYRDTSPSMTTIIKSSDSSDDIRMKALQFEEELLNEAVSDGAIDRKTAQKLRSQINAMQLDSANEI